MNRGGAARPIRFVVLIVLAIAVGVAVTLAVAGLTPTGCQPCSS